MLAGVFLFAMVDFVKIKTRQPGLSQRLLNDARLTFTDHHNRKGEKIAVKATYCALMWYVFPSSIVIEGSLHKCWNSLNGRGAINWNNFRHSDLCDTLVWLTHQFSLSLALATVHVMEVGVNATLPPHLNAGDVLRRLLTYKTHKFNKQRINTPGYYVKVDMTDFCIKAYDKGTQCHRPEPMVRFEFRAKRMNAVNQPKRPPVVTTLADLTDPARLNRLGEQLLTTFDRCILAESIDPDQLTPDERETVLRTQNANLLAALTRSQRNRLREKYDQLIARALHPSVQLRPLLRGLIADKWHELLTGNRYAVVRQPGAGDVLRRGECDVLQREKNPPHQQAVRRSTVSGIVVERCIVVPPTSTDVRRCPVTGYDITHQRANTRYVSASSVRMWYDLDRERFSELAGQFLKPKQAGADLKKQCVSIAHNIRNADTNPRNNPVRRLKKYVVRPGGHTLALFPVADTLKLSGRVLAALDYRRGTPYEVWIPE